MKELFNDILSIQDVQGIMLISFEGKLLFKEISIHESIDNMNLVLFVNTLNNIREAELIFDKKKIYIKKTTSGYLIVIMGKHAQIAMVRLNCDIVIPSLDQIDHGKKSNWFGKIFKR